MVEILEFPERERWYGGLTPNERQFADNLLRVSPYYRYELSGMPKLDPTPSPGVASAVAAAKAMMAWVAAR
jgi:hypothetical protein